ncbi:MAG: TRAP transporter large permease [Candidatus Accumulibacter sp.]|jgi:tripartite ATP-independent transporter DctM subunit|nr:TRAP transporter large permease [Accumulibacter sp.]
MDTQTVGILLLLGSFLTFVMLRIPVTFALIGSSVITALYLNLPIMAVWMRMTQGVQSFSLLAVPFFILAGEIMMRGGISQRLVDFSDCIVGRFRGGMAYVNILASTFFGAVSGSTTADISSVGATMIPLMEKAGYDRDFAINVTVTSATQSMIIPPSHNMIIYCLAAGGVSAGRMFLGGIIPGICLAFSLMAVSAIIAAKRNYPKGKIYTIKEFFACAQSSLLGLMTIVIILLGVCTGLFTATESAAIACLYAFFLTFFVYREARIGVLKDILLGTCKTLAMVLSIIAAASAFGYLLAFLKVPQIITAMLLSITTSFVGLILLINVMLLILGCIMDVAPLIVITTPILFPVASDLGMDPVQFGAMMLLNLAVGACTPPVGLALFTGCAVGRMPVEKVMKGILPFYAVMVVVTLLIAFVPWFSLFLPNLFMGIK